MDRVAVAVGAAGEVDVAAAGAAGEVDVAAAGAAVGVSSGLRFRPKVT